MKIVDFKSFKDAVNKLDTMAQVDLTKPNSVFPQKTEVNLSEKMKNFFDIADGSNHDWNS